MTRYTRAFSFVDFFKNATLKYWLLLHKFDKIGLLHKCDKNNEKFWILQNIFLLKKKNSTDKIYIIFSRVIYFSIEVKQSILFCNLTKKNRKIDFG